MNGLPSAGAVALAASAWFPLISSRRPAAPHERDELQSVEPGHLDVGDKQVGCPVAPTFSTLARAAHHGLKTSLSMLLLGIDDDALAGRASRARDEARADSASALLGGRRPAERERLLAVFEQIVDLVDERVNVPAAARRRRAKRSDD